jgi:hypothetical protein
MKPDERTIELIQADIDGELASADRAELSAALLANPAARQLHGELRTLCAALDVVPPEEPPTELRERIMAALPAVSVAGRRSAPVFGRRRNVFTAAPVALRYAAAFVGGFIVSTLAFQAISGQDGLSPRQLSGTITAPAALDNSRIKIDMADVRGSIAVQGTPQAPFIQARLAADREIQVIARLDAQEIRLGGFKTQGPPVELGGAFNHAASSAPVLVSIDVIDATTGAVLRRAALTLNIAD